MNGSRATSGMGWSARLLVGLVLIILGAAAATWALAHYQPAARFLGVTSQTAAPPPQSRPPVAQAPQPRAAPTPAEQPRLSDLETRLTRVENATRQAQGSAGRADALVVAFAARRAIDRGVALGYLEPLLLERFGARHEQAVATIVTASHQPVRLNELIAEYDAARPDASPRRYAGKLVERAFAANSARWSKSIARTGPRSIPTPAMPAPSRLLSAGEVDQALAETMRLPGAPSASAWVAKARRYILAHRALDEIESAALLGGPDIGR